MTSTPLAGKSPSSGTTPAGTPSSLASSPALSNPLQALAEDIKKKKWAAWVETEFEKCKNARIPFERQWYLNLAFYLGRQYIAPLEVAGHGFRLTTPKAPPHRVRLVINKTRTAVRTECAKLTSSKPIPTVMPATNEDEDYSAAHVGEQLVKSFFATAQFEETYYNWIWWGSVTGNSFMKSYWDPTAKDYDCMAEPQLLGPDGQPASPQIVNLIKQQAPDLLAPQPAVGKIKVDEISPFHIYVPDLLSSKLESQPYVMHVTTRSPLFVKNAFNIDVVPDCRASNTIIDTATLLQKGSQQHLDSVMVKEVWLKPNAHEDFPDGGVLTIINGQVVQASTKWPWPFREYPFYKFGGIPTGGFYCDSTVVDLIPIQKEYNRTKSQMVEIKNTMGKPKFLYAKGSINMRKVNTEAGQGIEYIAGYDKPTVLPGVEVPVSMGVELDRLSSDFDDISGQHEISRGNTPAQVTSGTAIAYLQEQDDTKLNYHVGSIERATEMLGKHFLKFVSHYWTDSRVVRIAGKDSSFESLRWKGSDLKGNTDVQIQSGSALPFSKAAKQAMVAEFMQNGWIPPDLGLELMDMGGYQKVIDDLLIDKRQAQRENAKMASMDPALAQQSMQPPVNPITGQPSVDPNTGQPVDPSTGQPWSPTAALPVPVNSWDNHQAHIQFHNNFRKTQQFELLDPAVKKVFELHVQMHQIASMGTVVNDQGMTIQNNAPASPMGPGPVGPQLPNAAGGPPTGQA